MPLKGTVWRVFPLIALIALGAFFHSTPGLAHKPLGFVRILWLFLEKEPGKGLEVRFDFGPRPGFSKQRFGSSRAPNWTGRALSSSYCCGSDIACIFPYEGPNGT